MSAKRVVITAVMSPGTLIRDLASQLDREELLRLIAALDREVADYGFTKALRDHFASEIKTEDEAL